MNVEHNKYFSFRSKALELLTTYEVVLWSISNFVYSGRFSKHSQTDISVQGLKGFTTKGFNCQMLWKNPEKTIKRIWPYPTKKKEEAVFSDLNASENKEKKSQLVGAFL